MNCREFIHRITPAVDGRLPAPDQESFNEHARKCARCRREFEDEQSLAGMIRARVRAAKVPPVVLEAILAATSRPVETLLASRARSLHAWQTNPRARAAAAFLLAFASVVWLFARSADGPHEREASLASVGDIVDQSVANYEEAVNGRMVPQVVSDRPDNVRTYFQGKTGFPVFVPSMRECTLVGGGVDEYRGMHLAHVLYRHGRQLIYLYQACRASVMEGDTLALSCEARSDLDRTGWHCSTAPDGAAIVLWVRGRTICAAVGRMNGEHLMAHLAEADEPGAW